MTEPGQAAGRVRIGLVGTGRIVREHHVPAYRANQDLLEVTAVADPDPASRAAVADALGVPHRHRHASLAGMLADGDLDLVVVASPPDAHYQAAAGALACRIAVISEKPLALHVPEIASLRATAGHGDFVAVLHNYLAKPGWRQLIKLVRDGLIGRPIMARFEELAPDHWRLPDAPATSWRQRPEQGGGPLRDNLYHALYLGEQILASELDHACGEQAVLLHGYPSGDAAAIVARHRSGALTHALAAWCHLGHSRATAEVLGTDGVLRYRYWGEPDRLYLDVDGRPTEALPVPGWSEALESGYAACFRETVNRFRHGQPPPVGMADAERIALAIAQIPAPDTGKTRNAGKESRR